MSRSWQQRFAILTALGTGAVVGAGGMYYAYVVHRYTDIAPGIAKLASSIDSIRRDVEELKSLAAGFKKGHREPGSGFVPPPAPSTASTTSDDDEFFDVSDERQTEVIPSIVEEEDIPESIQFLKQTFASVDWLMEGNTEDQEEAYFKLKNIYKDYDDNSEFLWRFAKSSWQFATILGGRGDQSGKKDLIFQALDFAAKAVEFDEESSEAHKWYAIIVGCRADYLPVKEKVAVGFEFKKHIDRAMEINPTNATLHYLLGRFSYEVSEISWIERKLASALFGEPPSATIEESLKLFERAEELYTGSWLENKLFLGKCHIRLGDYNKGVKFLDEAAQITPKTFDEEEAAKDVKNLLNKYKSYRT